MNNQPNIILFSVILGVIFVLVDCYTLYHWTAFAKKRAMNPWWYRSSWMVAGLISVMYWVVVYRRHVFRMDGVDLTLFGITTLWYLPKLAILPVLIFRDGLRVIRAIIVRWFVKVKPVAAPEVHNLVNRRSFLGTTAWSLASVPYVIVGNGMFRTLYDFQTSHVDLAIRRLPRAFDGMRIAQISDIHAGSFPDHRPFQEVRRILDVLKPDVIVITGDFVNAKPIEMSIIARDLAQLKAPYGVFASLGNHDHYNTPEEHKRLVETIRGLNIDLLINENRHLQVGGSTLVIAGTDNSGFRQTFAKLDKALAGVVEDEATILLAHDPTFWDKEVLGATNIDVMLAGHTHGGQLGVQLLGYEWSPAQYIYKQWSGLYAAGEQQLYVNKGIGTVGPPLRIGIPPEVTLFTLRSASVSDQLV